MKKGILLIAVLITGLFTQNAFAQDGAELGLRFGGYGSSNVLSIDGTLGLSESNRLHGDLNLGDGFTSVDLLYEWNFPISGVDGLSFYPGVGGSLFLADNYTGIGILGVAGLEYHFYEVPVAIGLGFRPYIGLNNPEGVRAYNSGWGLNVRYVF